MDSSTPLVPQRGDTKSTPILLTFTLTVIFVLVTCVVVFVKGQDDYKHGFLVDGAALFFLCISTAWLLNWVRLDQQIEDRVKYVAVLQACSLLFLCVAIMIVLFDTPAPANCTPCQTCPICPTCPSCASCCPTQTSPCNLTTYALPGREGWICHITDQVGCFPEYPGKSVPMITLWVNLTPRDSCTYATPNNETCTA